MDPVKERFRLLYRIQDENYYDPLDGIYEQHINVAEYLRMRPIDENHFRIVHDTARELKSVLDTNGNWMLVGMYVYAWNETVERDRLFEDCRAGRINLILTHSFRTLDPDIKKALSFCKELAEYDPPVGIFIEDMRLYTRDKRRPELMKSLMEMLDGRSETHGLTERK